MMTWWVAKLTCAWKFYSEKTGAQGQSHSRPGKSGSSGTKNRYDGRLPGCSGWPGLLWVPRPALGAPTTFAATAFTTVGSSGELFRLFCQESGFACSRADTAQFKLTEGLRPVGLASSPKPVPSVAAVACDSYGEPQVRAECQGRSSGRRAVLPYTACSKNNICIFLPVETCWCICPS